MNCEDCSKYKTNLCAGIDCVHTNWRPKYNKSKILNGCRNCRFSQVRRGAEPCKSCGLTHFEPKEENENMEKTAREEIQDLIDKPGDDTDFRTDLLNWVEQNYNPDSVFKDQLVKQTLKVLDLKHAYEQAEARKIELQRLIERYRKELGYSS